jgi:tetratricopeptide (TPR) repeat protein
VDGVMSAREIIQMLGLPEDEICRSLLGLLSTGLVQYREGSVRPDPSRAAAKPVAPLPAAPPPPAAPPVPVATAAPPPATPVAPPAPAPRVETPADRRREILEAFSGLNRNHYDVLGLKNDATPAQVKDAYFRLAKRFHPDVHTDPALADMHDKLEKVFIRLGQAYEALKNRVPDPPRAVPAAPQAPAPPSAPEPEPPAAPAMDELMVKKSIATADMKFMSEKYWDAIQLLEAAIPSAQGRLLSRGRVLLAKCFMKNPNWVRRAEEQVQLVLKAEPKNVDALYVLATIYKAGGLKARTIGALRRVLELRPEHEEAARDLNELTPTEDPDAPKEGGIFKKFFGSS